MLISAAPLEIVTGDLPVQASVIWLHGLGADGHDFAPLVHALNLPGVRFILPHAPAREVTVNGGHIMPAWYDISHPDLGKEEDEAGLAHSREVVACLIGKERARGIQPQQMVVAGFSQGGALALHAGLAQQPLIGGVMSLSGYLPLMDQWKARNSQLAAIPVFMAHGAQDAVVPLALAERSRKILATCGFCVEWHVYPMAHTVCEAEIEAIRTWLLRILCKSGYDSV